MFGPNGTAKALGGFMWLSTDYKVKISFSWLLALRNASYFLSDSKKVFTFTRVNLFCNLCNLLAVLLRGTRNSGHTL